MSRRTHLMLFLAVAIGILPVAAAQPQHALVFDSETKEYTAKPGEETAPFTFNVTNVTQTNVVINHLRTSCGCTVAQLPTQPYTLPPGSNVAINVNLDLRGKMGTIVKTVSIDSPAGFRSVVVRAIAPQPGSTPAVAGTPGAPPTMAANDRAKNIQAALNDRKAIFQGDCRSCHVDKGVGKMGKELYDADCGICHDAEHRAQMVPDLKVARSARDLKFWQTWVAEGKAGTMMPGFAVEHGGPLTKEQVDSLVNYLYQNFPKNPPATAATAPAARPVPTAILPPTRLAPPPHPAQKN